MSDTSRNKHSFYKELAIILGIALAAANIALSLAFGLGNGLFVDYAPVLAGCCYGLMPIVASASPAVFAACSYSCVQNCGEPLLKLGRRDSEKITRVLDTIEIILPIIGVALALIGITEAFGTPTHVSEFCFLIPGFSAFLLRGGRMVAGQLRLNKRLLPIGIAAACLAIVAIPMALWLSLGEPGFLFAYALLPLSYSLLLAFDSPSEQGSIE